MIDAVRLADSFALNTRLIHMQIAGLTHADSVLQPPFRSNNLNWVVGHLLVGQRVFGLYFHDTHHTSQAELLRQLAGTNDKIV